MMLMEPIYEQDFHDGSYGFRPKRSPHHAMDALWKETTRIGGGLILEVDLRKPPMPVERATLWFTRISGISLATGYVMAWCDALSANG